MKKLFTTLALLGTIVFGANAQKNLDLSMEMITPLNGDEYPNISNGDTFWFATIVTNNGPDAIAADDSIKFQWQGMLTDEGGNDYYVTSTFSGLELAAGESDTLVSYTTQGYNWGAGEVGTVYTRFNTDSYDTFAFIVYAREVDGNLIIEPDFEEVEPGSYNVGENNLSGEITVLFGTLSIFDINGLDKHAINIYPNPTNSEINFSQTFTSATDATANVYDITGKLVKSVAFGTQTAGTRDFQINVSELPAGNYSLEFVTNENRGISKFTVTK